MLNLNGENLLFSKFKLVFRSCLAPIRGIKNFINQKTFEFFKRFSFRFCSHFSTKTVFHLAYFAMNDEYP